MSDRGDAVIIETSKVDWTQGRPVGFIPLTTFYKEESANKHYKAPVSFFQDFGLGSPAWTSIDEHYFPEATWGDVYDVGMRGRPDLLWSRLDGGLYEDARLDRCPAWKSVVEVEEAPMKDEPPTTIDHLVRDLDFEFDYTYLSAILEKDLRTVSSPKKIRAHSAYQKIVALGVGVIDLIETDIYLRMIKGSWTKEVVEEISREKRVS